MFEIYAQTAIHKILKSHLVPSDNYIYGFANLSGLLHKKFMGYSYGLSIGRKLDDRILDGIKDAPTLEYLNHYTEINNQLLSISEAISDDLKSAGIHALVIRPTVTTDPQQFDRLMPNLRYELSHKMVATRAGLGWIGKTGLLSRELSKDNSIMT
jgi:epoxyqueuosine reductase